MRTRPLAALALLLACGRVPAERAAPAVDLARLLPAPADLPGLSVVEGPDEYLPATVFEVLDGAAPVYASFGFRRLVRVRWQHGDDARAGVTLDVLDMGSPLGAFGIYRSALPAAAPPRPWGAEGYRRTTVAAAWKGAVYVHGEADADTPALTAALERAVAHAAGAAPGEAALPPLLAPLPREHLVPRSERWVPRDLLGHESLPGGMVALYAAGGAQAELFFADIGGGGAARAALELLRDLTGGTPADAAAPLPGAGGFRFADPVAGPAAAVRSGRFVAGIRGRLPADVQERLLGELAASLAAAPR